MTLGEPAWAHRLASLALVELGRHDEAVVSAGEAVRRAPDDWRGLVTLSEALAHGEPEQAVRAARAAVDRAPEEARTHEVLGDAAMLAHDWMLAEHAYRDALRLDPTNPDVPAKLERVLHRPADDPRRRRRPVRTRGTPRFERVHRVAWYVAIRRAAAWQAVGAFVLLVTPPVELLAWYGLGLLLFVGFLAWRAWARRPDGAWVPLATLYAKARMAVIGGAALAASVAVMLAWTVAVALGAATAKPLLVMALVTALAGVACTWLALRRMWTR